MWTVQDAKTKFSAVVEAALAGPPQEVSRCGRPVVVVLSIEDYHQLLQAAKPSRECFAAHLMAFPAGDFERAGVQLRDGEF